MQVPPDLSLGLGCDPLVRDMQLLGLGYQSLALPLPEGHGGTAQSSVMRASLCILFYNHVYTSLARLFRELRYAFFFSPFSGIRHTLGPEGLALLLLFLPL